MKILARTIITFVPLLLPLLLLVSCNDNKVKSSKPVEAKDALATFQVAEGFQIEMIASEPLISDPVDMEIDEDGRMYVVEMHGYPLDKSGSGKIILLNDENGDGVMDKRTVFKDGLVLPNSVMRWKKGILVTDAPALLYLEDTDGDGVANVMDTVITGFALTNPQHNVNSPVYGMDNWIYIAHEGAVSTREYKEEFGDEGSEITFLKNLDGPKLPKNANGRSIRIQPDKNLLEMNSSRCQYGQTFDAWGHRFGCNNSNQGYQEVIADRYFQRNPDLPVSDATHDMSDHLNAAEVFPITTNPDRQLLTDVGVMTSGSGLTAYLGGLFPPPYDQDVTFIAEPVNNLVHVDKLSHSGASFKASRILQDKEFLASTDAWSRPVNFYVGPDGALYVLDYYRKVIESPEWMSEEAIAAGGLYDGSDKGRIYRITPKGTAAANWTQGINLGKYSARQLANLLSHKNFWWRINAQRLLVDKKDASALPALDEVLLSSSAYAKVHALWVLQGMEAIKPSHILRALKDSNAGVRENAIQIAEHHLEKEPALKEALLSMQNDDDAKVRFQLLLTLGYMGSPEAEKLRNKILFHDIDDKWVQVAALTAGSSHRGNLLNTVLTRFQDNNDAYTSLTHRLAMMVGNSGSNDELHQLINQSLSYARSSTPKSVALLSGVADGLKTRKEKTQVPLADQRSLISCFFDQASGELRNAALNVLRANNITNDQLKSRSIQKAAAIMQDKTQPAIKRSESAEFLALGDPSPFKEELKKLVDPKEETIIQLAALRTLNDVPGTDVSSYIISIWPELTPEIRDAAIETFMNDSNRVSLLIDALEKEKIDVASVSFPRSVQLMQNSNDDLRNRARKIFTKTEREREQVNKKYAGALKLDGDAVNGKIVFQKNCAICHQVRGKIGVAFGPDLGTVQNWIKEDVLANILDPGLSIASGFDLWRVELGNGEVTQGIIASETPVAITLRNTGKMDVMINRRDMKSIKAMNFSAMPTGLENNISTKEMADLLAFLKRHQDFK